MLSKPRDTASNMSLKQTWFCLINKDLEQKLGYMHIHTQFGRHFNKQGTVIQNIISLTRLLAEDS